ncbi:phage tail protein [Phormidesmis sp. 146-33]
MANQLLQLIFSATDKASGTIDNITRKLGGLGNAAQRASQDTGGLSNAIAFGMVKAEAAIAVVQQGYGKLQSAITEASGLQLQNMTAAQTFASLTGQSFDEGAEFIDKLTDRLAKSAAALPGATKDFVTLGRAIQDNVVGAFKGADGKLSDMKGFENTIASISENYGVLSASSGVDIGNTSLGLTKALGGASISELRQIQFFEQNQTVLNYLDEQLKKSGAKSLRDLDEKSRVWLLKTAGEKFVTDDLKKRASKSVDGLYQNFISGVIDPTQGTFGLMRNIAAKGLPKQTAFMAYNEFLDGLIGDNGLFSKFENLTNALGLTIDPMKVLYDALKSATSIVQSASTLIQGQLDAFKPGVLKYFNFGDKLELLFNNVSAIVFTAFNGIGEKAATLVNGLVNSAIDLGSQALLGFDYEGATGVIGKGLEFLFNELGSFLANLDPSVYATIAGAVLLSSAVPAIGLFAATLFTGFLAATAGLPVLLTVAAGLAIASLVKTIIDNFEEIKDAVGYYFGRAVSMVGGIIDGVLDAVRSFFTAIADKVKGMVSAAVAPVQNVVTGITEKPVETAVSAGVNVMRTVNPLAGAIGTISDTVGKILPKYQGNIPTAAMGFLGAIKTETENMPIGASPVIANSSETILTPSMLRNLVSGVSNQSGRGGGSIAFSPTFYITGGSDPEETARQVLSYLDDWLSDYQLGALG